jgi:SAM-dependent methyltransferase
MIYAVYGLSVGKESPELKLSIATHPIGDGQTGEVVSEKGRGQAKLRALVRFPLAKRLRRLVNRFLYTDLFRLLVYSAFDETSYLRRYKDVRAAVADGVYSSGYEHFIKHGRKEDRDGSRCCAPIAASHAYKDYKKLVQSLLRRFSDNKELAMAKSVGSQTMGCFYSTGNKQVSLLCNLGLQDDWVVYDLSCGCGRTAQALARSGWSGKYTGVDIIEELIRYAQKTTTGYLFMVHHSYTVVASDNSLDLVFAWSLFTHLLLEEISLYIDDAFRALRPGGQLIFSFLELANPDHRKILDARRAMASEGSHPVHLDTFLHRQDISVLAANAGFHKLRFIDGADQHATAFGAFGQSVVVLEKP